MEKHAREHEVAFEDDAYFYTDYRWQQLQKAKSAGESDATFLSETPEGLRGKIFLAEEHQENIAADHVVFIDQGANDGVQRGQIYKIYYQESDQRNPNKAELRALETIPFGELVVLHTESTTATCLVLSSRMQIKPGAVIGNFTE